MRLILFIITIMLLTGIAQNVWAGKLLLDYPDIPGAGKLEEQSSVPELIRYIYLFSLGIVGFVALLSILIGAVRYVTAGANTSLTEDAKKQIKQALLGVLILLAAVLILRTINPDLIRLGEPDLSIAPAPNGGNGENESIWRCMYVVRKNNGTICRADYESFWCKIKEECKPLCDDLVEEQRNSNINKYTCGEGFTVDGGCSISTTCE